MEWIIERARQPKEIIEFMESVFCILEIRGTVGQVNGIKFLVHTNEKNHAVPHVHAEYGEYNVSISFEPVEIIAGNLPQKQRKTAITWVERNKKDLLGKWSTIAISATSALTKSTIEMSEDKDAIF